MADNTKKYLSKISKDGQILHLKDTEARSSIEVLQQRPVFNGQTLTFAP